MSRTTELEFENLSVGKYVKTSLVIHAALFLFFTVKATFFADAPIQLENAIRVDIVGMPDRVAEVPKLPEPAAPPKPVEMPKKEVPPPPTPVVKTEPVKQPPPKAKEPDAINLDKTKSKQKQALEKLKQMQALENIQKDLENENKKKAAQAAKEVKYKGNVLNAGTELTGISKLQAENYTNEVYKHMKNYWEIPQYIKNNGLSAMVLVRFDESGNILSKSIVKSSGNQAFDEIVLTAIQNSSPVPPPPGKFAKIASVEGFLFRFRPDQ
jgi:colicin import membrane protein